MHVVYNKTCQVGVISVFLELRMLQAHKGPQQTIARDLFVF